MKTISPQTRAAELRFKDVFNGLNALFEQQTSSPLFKHHASSDEILDSIHRFRALAKGGLLALAKDIARVVVDGIDLTLLRQLLAGENVEGLRSLKLFERFVARMSSLDQAKEAFKPLFGIYELRLGDAHLGAEDLAEAFQKVPVDTDAVPVEQGRQLIEGAFLSMHTIFELLTR